MRAAVGLGVLLVAALCLRVSPASPSTLQLNSVAVVHGWVAVALLSGSILLRRRLKEALLCCRVLSLHPQSAERWASVVVELGRVQASDVVASAPPGDVSALPVPYAVLVDNFSQPLGQVTAEQAAPGGGRLRWQRFIRLEQGAALQLDIDMNEASVVAPDTGSSSSLDSQPAAEAPEAAVEFTDAAGGYSLPAFLHLARAPVSAPPEQCSVGQQRSLPSTTRPSALWLVGLAALCGLEAVGLAAALLRRPGAGQPEACSGQRLVPSAAPALVDACCSPMLQSASRLLANAASTYLSQGQAAKQAGGSGSPVCSKAGGELPAGWTRYA